MSKFVLTTEEDALVVTALQYLAEVQTASHGAASDDVKALLAKMSGQQVSNEPVVEEVEEVTEEVAEEVVEETADEAAAE